MMHLNISPEQYISGFDSKPSFGVNMLHCFCKMVY